MPSKTIPLIGQFSSRNTYAGSADYDQIFKNVVLEVSTNKITNTSTVWVAKRPGLNSGTLIDSGGGTPGEILVASDGSIIQVFGFKIYRNANLIADFTSDNIQPNNLYEIEISQTKYLVFFVGVNGYYSPFSTVSSTDYTADTTSGNPDLTNFNSPGQAYIGRKASGTGIPADTYVESVVGSTVTLTNNATANGTGVTITLTTYAKIIDSDFPDLTFGGTRFVQLDGYTFFGQSLTSRIYNTDLNSITSVGASSYITANMFPDRVRNIARYKNNIAVFGDNSIEFLYNAGNSSGSPLSRADQLTTSIGLANANGLVSVGDTIFFTGVTSNGFAGVFKLENYNHVKVSNQFIDRNLGRSNGTLSAFVLNGLNYVVCANSYRDYVYCVEQDFWSEIKFDLAGVDLQSSASALSSSTVYFLGAGYRYEMNAGVPVYRDASTDIAVEMRTIKLDFETGNRKTFNRVTLIGADKQSSGTATLEYSDDDYATWVTAGTFDLTKDNPEIYRCGSHKGGRAWRITHTANTAFRARALKFDYEVGAH